MSFKGLMRWFIGDDKPLGPESERGLFDHFNRPETIPFPPPSEQAMLNSSAEFYDEERRRNDMVPCPARRCGLCGTAGEVTKEMADEYHEFNERRRQNFVAPHRINYIDKATGKAAKVDGEYKPTFRDIVPTEPRELKPTVGYYNSPPPRDYPNAPTIPVPYAVRPRVVAAALNNPNIPMEVHEYIVHLESHFARTHHHGK